MGIAPLADDLATQLYRRGFDVSVITSFPYYPDWQIPPEYHGKLFAREDRNGVDVYRSYLYARPKATVLAKALFYASFTASSLFNIVRAGRCDVILVMAPPPTLVLSAWVSKLLYGSRIVLDVQDVVPDAAISFGIMTNPIEIWFFRLVERIAYALSDSIVVVTDNFVTNLLAKRVAGRKLSVVYNWVDTDFMAPLPKLNGFRDMLGLSDTDCLVMYAGNFGASQGLDVVLEAAARLNSRTDIHFAFVGGGTMAATLKARASELALSRTHFLPAVPFRQMPEVQAAADIGLVIQKANVRDVNLPSKIPVIMACGRPIVGAVNPSGDAYRILTESGGALLAHPGDNASLASAITELADDKSRAKTMGERGRAYAVKHFSQRAAIDAYLAILLPDFRPDGD